MKTRIPAGLLDSGFTALGTFIINLYAIDQIGDLDNPADLGVYGLFMAAFLFVAAVTTQVMFIPAEKVTLDLEPADRTGLAGAILVRGAPVSAGASLLVSLAALFAASQGAAAEVIVPLLTTAVLAGVVTPLQDHIRRLLHLAEHSWDAAVVSAVQLVAAVGWLIALATVAPNPLWVPFGAIGLSRLTSLVVGVGAAARITRGRDLMARGLDRRLAYGALFVSGRYLAATGALSTGNNLVVAAIITAFIGFDVLAYAEAARTVAQPVLVLANGLRSVTGPRSMESARDGDLKAARDIARTFYVLSGVLAVGYVVVAGFDWVLNPLRGLAEEAYVVGGLVIVTILANVLNGVAFPNRFELIGADKERSLLGAEVTANGVQLGIATVMAVVAGTSVTVGAMTRPVAFAGLGASRLLLYRRELRRHYEGVPA
jgi:O-antigen/teichoic acid export membrane protein